MEIIRHLRSSAVRFFQLKRANIFAPDFVQGVKERYRFWVAPSGPQEFDVERGVGFSTGSFQETTITDLKFYANGILVEADATTELLDGLIDDLAKWITEKFDCEYEESSPVAKGFTSSLEIKANPNLTDKISGLEGVAERLTIMVAGYGITLPQYELSGITLQTDAAVAKPLSPGRFVFERRNNRAFDEGVFYTQAPVSTKEHIELLGMLEKLF